MRQMRSNCGTLKDRWYVACTSQELRTKRLLHREILEEQLVLYRDKKGQACCLLDRCLHRNARLSLGRVQDGQVVCPYHGWKYDERGRCTAIPSLVQNEGRLPTQRVTVFPVVERHDLVWVYMGDPHSIQGEPFPIPYWNHDGWRSYYMVTEFDNSVTNCAENFMDVPHTVFVHAGWFRSQKKTCIRAIVERKDQSVIVTYHSEDDNIGYSQLLLNPKREPMTHTDKFYMPNITRVDYHFGQKNGFIITSQCTPVAPLKTIVYTAISYRLGWLNKLARFFLPPYTRKVIQQDVEIMANQGYNLARYPATFLNSPADVIHRFIESYRSWAEEGEKDAGPKDTQVEILFYV